MRASKHEEFLFINNKNRDASTNTMDRESTCLDPFTGFSVGFSAGLYIGSCADPCIGPYIGTRYKYGRDKTRYRTGSTHS